MFPVPSHLPRTGGEYSASRQNSSSTSPNAGVQDEVEVDLVLDLFEPLLKEKELKSETVRNVRERLEIAARDNKNITHELVKANYPSISSHIRAGSEIKADFGSIQTRLAELEAQIDPTNAETSFIPPVLAVLQRHFTAVRSQSRSKAHITALKDLKSQVERLDKLETAVYEAGGADEEVLDELEDGENTDLTGALTQSSVFKTLQGRRELLRSMVVEQVTDGFKQAVKLQEDGGSPSITAEKTIRLQRPRNQRPGTKAQSVSKDQPRYTLPQLYSALSRLHALEVPLRQLQAQIVEQLITPLLRGQSTIKLDSNDTTTTTTLHLISATARTPTEILADLSSVFDYIKSSAFPESPNTQSERDLFFTDLHGSTTRLLLSELVLPSLPPSRADLSTWLATIQSAVEFESQSEPTGSSNTHKTLLAFYDDQAGSSWANSRRRRVADQVRKLILDGWEGWEAVAISRDKEISVVVEVEVEDEDEPMPISPTQESKPETTIQKDADSNTNSASTSTTPSSPEVTEEEAGWGFDEDAQQNSQAVAGPSSPKRNGQNDDVEDGWAFDDDLSTAAPAPAPAIVPKPTREAKKLGKRVAKAKAPSSGDEDDTTQGQGQGSSIHNTRSSSRTTSDASSMPPPAVPERARVAQNEAMDWEAWDDEKTSPKTSVKPKAKRKVLKEEKRTIKETFLVSKACETLLGLAEEVLRDAQEIQADLPAPSFSLASTVLHNTATEVFDLYRALLTSHYATQLQSVPTLSMQVYNDSIHLSDRIRFISDSYEKWSSTSTATDTQRRLRESGEACFERELDRQRSSLISTLDDLEWVRGVEGLKRSQGVPKQVRGDLEDLSRMFQTVLPTTTFLSVMGYLVNVSITYITDAILSQQDITEDESIQLTELLRTLHPLEELFILEPGQPSSVVEHVHGWLKFCYLQELLSANLVDITYLFENGALVDFTPDELISLLKALFADSEKRENAIERIERGL